MILATLCYVKKDGQTLMIHRNKRPNDIHEGKWNGLGGKFEKGESPEECVIREVWEESGLTIHAPRLHGLLTFTNFKGNNWYVYVFTAHDFEGRLLQEVPEGKLEWIPDDEVLNLPLWDSDQVFLPWLAQERFFSAKFNYDGDRFINHAVAFY
ncbi:MAG: 8-oxo-dGTP diphosphatase [Anaerolineales bacterium]|uniref:NUDIX hydrolase n=1 Tax=Candidatus Villigracilis affinis TaxID=3140682 RepID=UPI002A20F485|nr:8-oxo-dGTP diphosphatase [Anaerolineales bacterium]MBL0347287.1 8-oxo-dGTP diphosphatase [Anaerolineales bacterium]